MGQLGQELELFEMFHRFYDSMNEDNRRKLWTLIQEAGLYLRS